MIALIGDTISGISPAPFKGRLAVLIPSEVRMSDQILLGLIGTAISIGFDIAKRRRIERMIANGQLVDPDTNEDIMALCKRYSWEFVVV